MSSPDDRRRHSRRTIAVPAEVRLPGRPPLRAHAVDLSAGGACLACVGLPDRVQVGLKLPAREIAVTARVVRREPGRTAVEFERISDVDRRTLASFCSGRGRAAA